MQSNITDFLRFYCISFVFYLNCSLSTKPFGVWFVFFFCIYIVLLNLKQWKYCCYPAPLILFYSMCTNKSRCKMGERHGSCVFFNSIVSEVSLFQQSKKHSKKVVSWSLPFHRHSTEMVSDRGLLKVSLATWWSCQMLNQVLPGPPLVSQRRKREISHQISEVFSSFHVFWTAHLESDEFNSYKIFV